MSCSDDYSTIIGLESKLSNHPLADVLDYLEDVSLDVNKRDDGLKEEPRELLDEIDELLTTAAVEHQDGPGFIRMRGATISVADNVRPEPLKISADPLTIHLTLPTIDRILNAIRAGGVRGVQFCFTLAYGMDVVQEAHKITARLYDSHIKLSATGELIFRNLSFATWPRSLIYMMGVNKGNAKIMITPLNEHLELPDLADLLRLLLSAKVAYQIPSAVPGGV